MSRQLLWSVALIGGALILAAIMISLRPVAEEEERIAEVPLVESIPFKAASGPIPVLASGTVQALDEVIIGAQVSGRVTYVNPAFREGGKLGAGATILRIEASEYVNRVNVAKADVAAQEVAVLQAKQEVAIAGNELNLFAEREAQMASGSESSAAIILPPNSSEPSAATSAAPISQEASGLATREPQLRSAEASLDRASATLSDAELALARTRVKAPFRSLVRQADVAVGTLVQPGQALGSIVATSSYEVRVTLSADEASLIPGLFDAAGRQIPATVYADYGGQTYRWPAYVDRASALLDATTRNIEVYLRVPSPLTNGRRVDEGETAGSPQRTPPLLLGEFARAEITGSSLESYAAIPANALRPGNEIWVVRDGKLAVLEVRVIQRRDAVAYIATPTLDQGGSLVVSTLRSPVEGMQLRVAGTGSQ